MEYRLRDTGALITRTELKAQNPNMSLPKGEWGASVLDALNADPVHPSVRPEPSGTYKRVIRNGAVQDSNGLWMEAWTEVDMFTALLLPVYVPILQIPGIEANKYAA